MEHRDSQARQQFIEEIDDNFRVAAGAGVGKTTAIVERIAQLAERKIPNDPQFLSRLVVVTYGRLAAEELRLRTRQLLIRRGANQNASQQQRILSELSGAFFGTIHSFCLHLIGMYGHSLQLPDHPELLESDAEDLLWERFCQSLDIESLEVDSHAFAAVRRHLTFSELLGLARLLDPADLLESQSSNSKAIPLRPALNFVECFDASPGSNPKGKETTLRHQAYLRRWLQQFETETGYLRIPQFKGGSQAFLTAFTSEIRPYIEWFNKAAAVLAANISREWTKYKLSQAKMSYRDMVYWTYQLVASDRVRAKLRSRGYIVILDEAQDTDAEMFAILSEIARPIEAGFRDWPERACDSDVLPPRPGAFCFVGDEQQAIYGDRADLKVYQQYIQAFQDAHGGRHLEFFVSMRCPRENVALVNTLFDPLRIQQSHAKFRQLDSALTTRAGRVFRLECSEAPPPLESDAEMVDAGNAEADGGKLTNEDRIAAECETIAASLSRLGPEAFGATNWSDIAVLAPRVSWLETGARVFRKHGLKAILSSQKVVGRERPTESWPAALFYVLTHPWNRFELVGVLREIFVVSDVELARWHLHARQQNRALGFWPASASEIRKNFFNDYPESPETHRLESALELLRTLRSKQLPRTLESFSDKSESESTIQNVSQYVSYVLHETRLADRLRRLGYSTGRLDALYLQRDGGRRAASIAFGMGAIASPGAGQADSRAID